MDIIAEVRRPHLVSKESISSLAGDLKLSRPTIRKHPRTQSEPVYQLHGTSTNAGTGDVKTMLESWLQTEHLLPKAQRRTAQRLLEDPRVPC